MVNNNENFTANLIERGISSIIGFYLIPTILLVLCALTYFDIIAFNVFNIILLACVIFFIILPIIFRYSYSFQRAVVFLNFINVPSNSDYHHPEKYGIKGARNFYIKSGNVELGTWQILPANLQDSNHTSEDFFNDILNDGQNIVIYNHGNGGCRLTSHRIEIYKLLRKFFHVITYDYRSYGDSASIEPSEAGLVEDVLIVYNWIRNRTKSNIFIWGHSLGTSLSTHAILELQNKLIQRPIGLILESPFNTMKDEIRQFPLAKIFAFLPWFKFTVSDPLAENFHFYTDQYICKVNVPIMILHAEDDKVVPFELGYRLYNSAKICRSPEQGQLIFHKFSGSQRYGHKFICRAPELAEKISNFIQLAVEWKVRRF